MFKYIVPLISILSFSSNAAQDSCKPNLNITTGSSAPVHIVYEDINKITNESQQDWTEYAKKLSDAKTLGYTKVNWDNQFKIYFDDSKYNCLIPNVSAVIQYKEIIVKIAEQIKGTEKELLIKEHEQLHVKAFQNNLEIFKKAIENDIKLYFNHRKLTKDSVLEKNELINYLQEKVDFEYKKLIKPKHLEIDSAENYIELAEKINKIK
jgi:hypothetical protein